MRRIDELSGRDLLRAVAQVGGAPDVDQVDPVQIFLMHARVMEVDGAVHRIHVSPPAGGDQVWSCDCAPHVACMRAFVKSRVGADVIALGWVA